MRLRIAAARWLAVCSLATSSATSATASTVASFGTVIGDHCSSVTLGFWPEISSLSGFVRRSVYSRPKNSRLATSTALLKLAGNGRPAAICSIASHACSILARLLL